MLIDTSADRHCKAGILRVARAPPSGSR
jgi:hypothetical protein